MDNIFVCLSPKITILQTVIIAGDNYYQSNSLLPLAMFSRSLSRTLMSMRKAPSAARKQNQTRHLKHRYVTCMAVTFIIN